MNLLFLEGNVYIVSIKYIGNMYFSFVIVFSYVHDS